MSLTDYGCYDNDKERQDKDRYNEIPQDCQEDFFVSELWHYFVRKKCTSATFIFKDDSKMKARFLRAVGNQNLSDALKTRLIARVIEATNEGMVRFKVSIPKVYMQNEFSYKVEEVNK